MRINNATKCATVSVGLPCCVEACSLELWPLTQLCAVASPYERNNSDFQLVILNQSCLIGSNVGGWVSCWGPAPLSMFTSLIMKLEPCGAHTPGLHWSPNSIAPLINAQMTLADPLPFLSHILYSAAPSVSTLPVLFFTHSPFTLSFWHHCVRLSAAYANSTWPVPDSWYLYLRDVQTSGHTCYK